MRRLLVASVLAAGLAGTLASSAHPPVGPRRKSMGFGPDLPHSVFRTDVPESFWTQRNASPFSLALDFATDLLSSSAAHDPDFVSSSQFIVRSDSYTDSNTGISHVYLKQVVAGIEVADADVNVNIKDGKVLSYGSSIFTPTEGLHASDADVHATHCARLTAELSARQAVLQERFGQTVLGSEAQSVASKAVLGPLPHLYASNCEHVDAPYYMAQQHSSFSESNPGAEPLSAVLQFMVAATPDDALSTSIMNDPTPFLDKMSLHMHHNLHSESGAGGANLEIEGVPGTIDKVKGRLAWVQVPNNKGKTSLELVWKFEVPMQDNWYEAAVTHDAPHRIVSVVDWAADGFVDEPTALDAFENLFEDGVELLEEMEKKVEDFLGKHIQQLKGGRPLFGSLPDVQSKKPCHMKSKTAPVPKEPEFPATRIPAQYNVFRWGINDPSEGNRTIEKENFDSLASPAGWHVVNSEVDPASKGTAKGWYNTSSTWGNNVFAHENWEGENAWVTNYRPTAELKKHDSGEHLLFDFEYDPQETERTDSMREARKYINTTVTQLFYTSNMVHDLFYRYGFDEVSGNFQQHNFGRGGRQGDAVIANAQDGSGFNNANFMTPPDGQNGRCRMYLWNTANPYRDGDLEAGIVIHELAHGLSTRLTGGPMNSGCLGWGESGGMGEGWGDFLATTIRSNVEYSDYPMGAWAANRAGGIRNFVYSLNSTVNPSTYKTLDKPGYWGVHAIGEVWAEILWTVSNRLIKKHGFSDSLYPPKPLADGSIPTGDFYRPQESTSASGKKPLIPKHGNTLATQLVISGMKLQPCRPTFFNARDAIIQADHELTGGENFCELWQGFSERGLGPKARVDNQTPWGGGVRTDDFKLPEVCQEDDGDDGEDDDEDVFYDAVFGELAL